MLDFSGYMYSVYICICIIHVQTLLNMNTYYEVSLQLSFIQIFKQQQYLI